MHAAFANGEFTADRVANIKTLVAEETTLENQQLRVHARRTSVEFVSHKY